MKRNYLHNLIPFLLIFISLVAISCDNKVPEAKVSYSIEGKSFHIDFNRTRDVGSDTPDSMTIAISDDGSELLWTSLYSNYGVDQGKITGNSTAVSDTEFKYEESVTGSDTSSGTSLDIRFNDNGSVTITGKIASNDIPANALSSIISSAKSDNAQAFKERVYFGSNGSVGSYVRFSTDKVEYKLYTNFGTIFEADKASGSINYNEIVNFPHNPKLSFSSDGNSSAIIGELNYISDKDIFIDLTHENFILTRIK